jgi:Concanavalin A-like lectin/glucanases superfamily
LSAWVYVSSSVSDIQCIWANGPGVSGSSEIFFYVNDYKTSDGALILATGNGTTAANLAAPAGSVSLNQWHLVTAAVDRTDGLAQLYVDGNQVVSGAVRNDFPTGNDMELGRDTGGTFAFLGALDEARIHSSLESSNWVWASYMTVAANTSLESYSAVGSAAVSLNIQAAGSSVILAWPQGTLQSAGQITGPYSDVSGATSPYTNSVSGAQQYFRVKVQ